jgi:peptide deformylase
MAIRTIRVHPDPALRQKAKRISKIDSSICKLIDDMVETMKAAPGIGLAATQVGVPLRVIVVELPEEKTVMALINPQVIKRGGERLCEEACLSLPGYKGEVKRSEWVKVKGLDTGGKEIRIKGEDLLAQLLEHEIDHLNGVLYIDLMEDRQLVPVSEEPSRQANDAPEEETEGDGP